MQRFSFQVTDGGGAHAKVVSVLRNAKAARLEGTAICSDLARDIFYKISTAADWQLLVADEAGKTVCRFRVSEDRLGIDRGGSHPLCHPADRRRRLVSVKNELTDSVSGQNKTR
jgi:hypothetical protein